MRNGLVIYSNGDKYWYKNDKLHRENGPAVESPNGDKAWWINGKCHRVNGPALEYADGKKVWYINGTRLDCSSQEEFERLMKLGSFW